MKLLTASEVCYLVGISIYTLNNWYTFKRENPDDEYAKMLPEIYHKSEGNRTKRYWNAEDVGKLIEYRTKIPWGKNGVMGSVTQRYVKKKGDVEYEN